MTEVRAKSKNLASSTHISAAGPPCFALPKNPLLAKLGYSDRDRLLIVHMDDIGMCHASVTAFRRIIEMHPSVSASIMVPCPWFPAIASSLSADRQLQSDVGVHITLTSEWNDYRWSPISAPRVKLGLCDPAGYFWRTTSEARSRARPEEIFREMKAQIESARDVGIDITHIDAHMGVIFCDRLFPLYLRVASEYRIPAMMIRADKAELLKMGFAKATIGRRMAWLLRQEQRGTPMIDRLLMTTLENGRNRLDDFRRKLQRLPAGVSQILFHPSEDSRELRAITPDWRSRVADFKFLVGSAWRTAVQQERVHIVTWRDIKCALSGRSTAGIYGGSINTVDVLSID